MKGYLLDTSVILIAPEDPDKLSEAVQSAVLNGPNYLSVISYWEVMLKVMKGNLIIANPLTWWQDTLKELAAVPLFLLPQHVSGIHDLPPIHQDPFDRALIAQATAEYLTLVTTDRKIPLYASQNFQTVI